MTKIKTKIKKRYTEKQMTRIRQQNGFTPGRWMQIPWDLFLILSESNAIMLSYLINYARRMRAEEDHKGWFYCTADTMQKQLTHLDRDAQHHRLKQLRDAGFIAYKKKGMPAKRYIYINYDFIEKTLMNHVSEMTTTDPDYD